MVRTKQDKMSRVCNMHGGEEIHIWGLVGKPEGKKQCGRPKH